MNQKAIMARHPAIFGKQPPNKYGKCMLCGTPLIREWSGPDEYYICCPESHYKEGHTCFVDEEYLP